MHKIRSIFIGSIVCAAMVSLAFFSAPKKTVQKNSAPVAISTNENINAASPLYSLASVALHNSQANCWAAINGSVYDLTAWINRHPGGDTAILSLCGTDASAQFAAQHGGESKPAMMLTAFKIGILK